MIPDWSGIYILGSIVRVLCINSFFLSIILTNIKSLYLLKSDGSSPYR